jgi:hypothetical protein
MSHKALCALCHYAECNYAECRGAIRNNLFSPTQKIQEFGLHKRPNKAQINFKPQEPQSGKPTCSISFREQDTTQHFLWHFLTTPVTQHLEIFHSLKALLANSEGENNKIMAIHCFCLTDNCWAAA